MRVLFTFVVLLTLAHLANAQEDDPKVIQFTGVLMGQDSTNVIPGAHVYLPKGGRGVTTNPYGFFSLPVVQGDSIVFSAIGYKRAFYIVPEHRDDTSLKVIVTLEEDVTFLQEVEVFPFPNEEMFKRAVVTMKLPEDRDEQNLRSWISAIYMQKNYGYFPSSAAMNYRYFQDQQLQQFNNRFAPNTINLMNPWAWSDFINSIKNN